MRAHYALVGFSRENVQRMRPLAENHGKALGQSVFSVRFEGGIVI